MEEIKKREVKVLCLGLSRTGTMSLRAVFTILGYENVYHYMVPAMENPSHCDLWSQLLKKKYDKNELITRADLDSILENYEVTTDAPTVLFWRELLDAYPNAKVILQSRDIDQWYKSFLINIWPYIRDWFAPSWNPYRILFQYFAPRGPYETMGWNMTKSGFYLDFPNTGKTWYKTHYEAVESACKQKGRPVLHYELGMGWEPLCRFLKCEVPGEPFPKLNDTAKFQETWAPVLKDSRREINTRLSKALAAAFALVAGVLVRYRYSQT